MINLAPWKQYIENNIAYGENSREANKHKHGGLVPVISTERGLLVLSSLVMPNGARIWGVDISHWNRPPVDLKRMKELYGLQFVIIKGVDGSINSNYYLDHVAAAKAAGIPFGIYCWLYPASKVNIDTQVNAWYTRYQQDPPPMGLFIDAEWTYYGGLPANPTASDLRQAHDKWKAKSGKSATTYTAQGYANQYLQGFDWSREELWIANYGVTSPALPTGATRYKLWQFTSTLDGKQLDPNGNAELDGNYYDGSQAEFDARYKGVAPVPDVITTPYDGMTRINGESSGYWFELFKLDPAKFEFELVSTPNLETVPSVARRKGALLATNAGEWNDRDSSLPTYLKPEDYTVSNGVVVVQRTIEAPPSFMVLGDNSIVIDHRTPENVRQAFSGLRYIIGPLAKPSEWNDEGHARLFAGKDAAGNAMLMLSEGVYPNQGLKLIEGRQILEQYGAVEAADYSGGGDAGGVLNGNNLIIPENIVNGQNVYRALPMTFCVYRKDVNMTDGIAKENFGNQTRVRKTPSRYGEVVLTLSGYSQVNFTEKVPVQIQGTSDKTGEIYLKRTDGNFVNYKLYNTSGVLTEMFTILQEPTVDAPPVTDVFITTTVNVTNKTVHVDKPQDWTEI